VARSGGPAALAATAAVLASAGDLLLLGVAGSVAFALPVARGTSAYPRWMAGANPAALVVVIGIAASVAPWSRALIVPASPNLAHGIFFALMAMAAATPEAPRQG